MSCDLILYILLTKLGPLTSHMIFINMFIFMEIFFYKMQKLRDGQQQNGKWKHLIIKQNTTIYSYTKYNNQYKKDNNQIINQGKVSKPTRPVVGCLINRNSDC